MSTIKAPPRRPTTPVPTTNDHYYLVVRPISEDIATVEERLPDLARATGVDHTTLRQVMTGNAINVLKRDGDINRLEDLRDALKGEGVSSVILSRSEVRSSRHMPRAASIEYSKDRVRLLDSKGEALITFTGSEGVLIVLSSPERSRIHGKRAARQAMNVTEPLSGEEIVEDLFRSRPFMDIYVTPKGTGKGDGGRANGEKGARLDSLKFNFTSLGEMATNSIALNMPIIVKEIKKHSASLLIEPGFGEVNLPFMSDTSGTERGLLLDEFSRYSAFINLAAKRGIYNRSGGGGAKGAARNIEGTALDGALNPALLPVPPLNDLPVIGELGSLLVGTPPTGGGKRKEVTEGDEGVPGGSTGLPAPPDAPISHRYNNIFFFLNIFDRFIKYYRRHCRTIGPQMIVVPLAAIALIPLLLAEAIDRVEVGLTALLPLGLISFIHAFTLLKRKRTIENCPRSKVRSMPMGEVEVEGRAVPKYHLRSPYTMTDCVYYSYQVYRYRRRGDGKTVRELIESGNSGNIPFYLEDDTGKVLVLPEGAVIKAGRRETYSGDPGSAILGLRSTTLSSGGSYSGRSGKQTVETTIPAGETLYVMGFGHRQVLSAEEKKREYSERLRDLKGDRARMKRYDTNNDGHISGEEWDVAREELEERMLHEKLKSGEEEDGVAIGPHPTGGLFYISDKKEEHILSSMSWRIPLFFLLSLSLVLGGASGVSLVARSSAIIMELKNLL